MKRRTPLVLALVGIAIFTWSHPGVSYESYRTETGSGHCAACHPTFVDRGALHDLHVGNNQMTGKCGLCHTSTGDIPLTYSSGEAGGQGCRGCHGQDNGSEFSWGAGLRAHHLNAGAPPDGNGQTCADCHTDPPVVPENILPVYYSRDDVNVKNPCDSQTAEGEDFTGDNQGLDNDGDLAYDENDSDCESPSGTGDAHLALPELSISPNPVSSGATTFFLVMPLRSDVGVTVYDVAGRAVHTRRYSDVGPGTLSVPFGGRDRSGAPLPTGIYLVRIESATVSATARMVWIK